MRKQKETHPPIGTREIDRLAAEHYNGDTKALLYDYMNRGQSVERFVNEVTQEEAQVVVSTALQIRTRELGGHENMQRELMFQMNLHELDMEKDVFLNTTKNPFKKSLLLYTLGLCGTIVIGALCIACGLPVETIAVLMSAVIGIFSMSIAGLLLKYFKFRKTKRWYRETYEAPKVDASATTEEDDPI